MEYGNASKSLCNVRQSHETKCECDPIHVSLTVIRFKVDWIIIYRENTDRRFTFSTSRDLDFKAVNEDGSKALYILNNKSSDGYALKTMMSAAYRKIRI